jgi:hypothetical protein
MRQKVTQSCLSMAVFALPLVLVVGLGGGQDTKSEKKQTGTQKEKYLKSISDKDLIASTEAVRAAMPKIEKYMEKEPARTVSPPTLGTPLPCIWISLEHLMDTEKYKGEFKQHAKKVIFPVSDKNGVAYSIEVQLKETEWKITSFGKSKSSKVLFGMRDKFAATSEIPLECFYVFSVPALHFDFLALTSQSGKTNYALIADQSAPPFTELPFKAGTFMPATDTLKKLREVAKQLDGDDREQKRD